MFIVNVFSGTCTQEMSCTENKFHQPGCVVIKVNQSMIIWWI